MSGRVAPGVTLAAILVAAAAVRWRLLAVPLERDEGEYAYVAQLILQGEVPYRAAHNMKLPGVYYAYAAILGLFGETDVAVHLGLLVVNLLAIALLYALGRSLVDAAAGLGAAAAYATLSLGAAVAGLAANAEHFVVVPAIASALALAHATGRAGGARPGAVAAAGLLAGLAVVMKQHGAAFVAGGLAIVLADGLARGRGAWRATAAAGAVFAVAAALPYALTALGLWTAGAFEPFWFWTVTYAREYAGMIPRATSARWLAAAVARITGAAPALWLLAALGLGALAWDAAARRRAPFVLLWTASGLFAVALGLRFTDHYFILLLPAAALLAGVGASAAGRVLAAGRAGRATALAVGLVAVAAALALARERMVLFALPPVAVARAVNGTNPFPEAVAIGHWLRTHAAPDDRIAVIGSEPEVYFYARRRAATSYLYVYPLMERHPFARRMQDEMVAQLEAARPRFLVLVNVPTSWSRRPHSETRLLDWAERTVRDDYEAVGLAEIVPGGATRYHWGAAARAATPASPYYVATFRRRS